MKKLLPALGLAAGLAASAAQANTGSDEGRDLVDPGARMPGQLFTPGFSRMVDEMAKESASRWRVAQDFHDSQPFAKAPTFGKAGGGGGFVKFSSPKMMMKHKRHHADVETIFNLYKPS
jgi:hypothetical protein